jgi:uncharacterized protein YbjT (DUF2867 family)
MRILLFGASGTAGGAVLRACLAASSTEKSVAATAMQKDGAPVADAFRAVDACLFCLGMSVTQSIVQTFCIY